MAFCFGDGFDLYSAVADPFVGYWDGGGTNWALVPGRFTGSRAAQINTASTTIFAIKNSGQNDAVHHIVCAIRYDGTLSGTSLCYYFNFSDGATNQVTVGFRSDGAIVLQSGGPGGTTLDTYTGAVTAQATWFAFEFEVVIHPTAGSWAVRKNGNTSNDRALGSLNTRPGANSYANRITIGNLNFCQQTLDDVLWRSDASSVPWVGDVRCYTRSPASDVSVQFARSMASTTFSTAAGASAVTTAGLAFYVSFTPPYDGTISTLQMSFAVGGTGNYKCSIFSNVAGAPATVLGSANVFSNPTLGNVTVTFATPVTVAKGTQYWLGLVSDTSGSAQVTTTGTNVGFTSVTPYASFPVANPTPLTAARAPTFTATLVLTTNYGMVAEAQQDATATYVYDTVPGHADFYGVSPLAITPASVVAVVTRGLMQKSDAGTRTGTVQLKSGGTTVAATAVPLSTNFGWVYRTDTVDPATGLAWTPTAVNNVNIGPAVVT